MKKDKKYVSLSVFRDTWKSLLKFKPVPKTSYNVIISTMVDFFNNNQDAKEELEQMIEVNTDLYPSMRGRARNE